MITQIKRSLVAMPAVPSVAFAYPPLVTGDTGTQGAGVQKTYSAEGVDNVCTATIG